MRRNRRSMYVHFSLIIAVILLVASIVAGIFLLVLMHLGIINSLKGYPVIRLIITLLSCTVVGTVIAAVFSKRILRPLNEVVEGTRQIASGNFDVQIQSTGMNNDLEDLVQNFNLMSKELSNVELVHQSFINDFSHEMKTPLVSINGFAKQLQNPNISEEDRNHYLKIIAEETERLSSLASNVLLLSKVENQEGITLKKEPYSVDEQLRHALILLQKNWETKNLVIELNLQPITITADSDLFMQVWLNILGNAIHYTESGGTIEVNCYKIGNEVKVNIKDNGIGMSDKVRQHVFNKFYQGDSSHQGQGNGLGLPIAKRIVNLHNGKITVKSKMGSGSSFVVILPQ
ncbi:sensor histidine kinase [Enterococcus sp. BWR-S5]|uniref:sensor histidine kinase n=1 Tax=Enterococcus sp. BWR-S5 TaxID=2787714 RepID=UPI001924BA86|nr:HAMP domain-containing sensor histidine kinase [Enterococcus sp. BWR-S5]MBL1225761.1 HAMP domain-containing histidine kinase [Enterococcus sp. BWR-S5]